jgi:hypothetical protein
MSAQVLQTYSAMSFDCYIYFQSATTIIKEVIAVGGLSSIGSSFISESTYKTSITVTGFYFTAVTGTFADGSYVNLMKSE